MRDIFTMVILVTGAAGFIGYHVSKALMDRGDRVIGIDNLNDYYDVALKRARLDNLAADGGDFSFHEVDIADRDALFALVESNTGITHIIHLAAQAGVRYSLIDPYSYVRTNVDGYLNLLEASRKVEGLEHFVYASSSSVYGANEKLPFSIEDRTDRPLSLYAATKKSSEMMAHCYSHLYRLPLTGLRFFTVYGPWGRPDMAYFGFTQKILAGEPIDVFNNGDMRRDFTYIDDIVDGVINCLGTPPVDDGTPPCRVYNIGNNQTEGLMDMIGLIEDALGQKAEINMMGMQAGDFKETFADITETERDFNFSPKTRLADGIPRFIDWYRDFYSI